MPNPRHTRRRLGPASLDIEVTHEVSVGAFARRRRMQRVAMGVGGAALLLGAIALFLLLNPMSGGRTFTVMARCVSAACGFEGAIAVPTDKPAPFQCPRCKQPSCRELWQCRSCGERFIHTQSGIVKCPKCDSDAVGAATGPSTAPASKPTAKQP